MSRPRASAALALLPLAYGLVRFVAWSPPPLRVGLCPSWRVIMHEAWQHGWVAGRDVVFTYGPYGFLHGSVPHPLTYTTAVVAQALLMTIVVAALWMISGRVMSHPFARLVAVGVAVELMVTPREGVYYAAVALLIPFGLRALEPDASRGERLMAHAVAAAAALVALVKFTFFVALVSVLSVLTLTALGRRRLPWQSLTAVASLVVLLRLAGQPLAALGAYLQGALQITGGYSAAMALAGPSFEPYLGGLAALLVVVLYTGACVRRDGLSGLLPAGAVALLVFMVFKASFVRHDWHARIAVATLVPLVLILSERLRSALAVATGRWLFALLGAVLLVMTLTVGIGVEEHDEYWLNWPRPAAVGGQLRAMAEVLAGRRDVADRWHQRNETIKRQFVLPPLSGRVDNYPHYQSLLVAHGLELAVRPVIGSYSVYTPELARRNRDHLRTSAAADAIVFSIAPIEQHYPSLDDGLSWPELMSRYDLLPLGDQALLLTRRTEPKRIELRPLGERTIEIGALVDIPEPAAGAVIWAELELDLSVAGRALSLAFKPPFAFLEIGRGDRHLTRYRLVPGMAAAGFLLSPTVATTTAFAEVASGDTAALASDAVRSLRVTVGRTAQEQAGWRARAYRDAYELRLFELAIY